ncbi:MAG: hypothetical protein ACM3Q2_12180 [Syntrophothermus sp.]
MRILTAAVVASLIFAGCGGSSKFVLNQNYENTDFTGKVLLIAPISKDAIKVVNKEDVKDNFPKDKREPEEIIQDMVYKNIMDYAGMNLTGVKIYNSALDSSIFLSQYDKSKYLRLYEPLNNNEVLPFFYIPKKEVLYSHKIRPDLILVMNRLKFERKQRSILSILKRAKDSETLNAEFEYILYNYNKNEVVAIGEATADSPFSLNITWSTWDEITRKIAPEFFKKMPFQISKRQ